MNCWEFRGCGREPGGRRVPELGVCPAAEFAAADGFLGGRNGGRACAFVAGTYCDDAVQGNFRSKLQQCWGCSFYRELRREHGAEFSLPAFALFLAQQDPSAYACFYEQNHSDRRSPD